MLAWRVEHRYKKRTDSFEIYQVGVYYGPYTDSRHNVFDMAMAHNNDNFPTPYEEGYKLDRRNQTCAFRSEEDLMSWFSGWYSELYERDFVIRAYDLPPERVTDIITAKQILVDVQGIKPTLTKEFER